MKRRSIARLIAICLLGYCVAFMLVSSDKSDMSHYRTLSRDALLAELATKNDGDFDTEFFAGIFIVGSVVLLVDGIGWVAQSAMNRISPLPPTASTELAEVGAHLR